HDRQKPPERPGNHGVDDSELKADAPRPDAPSMGSLTPESWVIILAAGGAGLLGAAYGVASILERELEKVRLARRARLVMEAHRRRLDLIARGEADPAFAGELLDFPIEAFMEDGN